MRFRRGGPGSRSARAFHLHRSHGRTNWWSIRRGGDVLLSPSEAAIPKAQGDLPTTRQLARHSSGLTQGRDAKLRLEAVEQRMDAGRDLLTSEGSARWWLGSLRRIP